MTEKLTYDPTPADAPEFTEEEQAALEVADKLGQEENDLILGKFKDADDLAKAYTELEKKLGSNDASETPEETEEAEESPGVALINAASAEFTNNDGQLSKETMEKFTEMSSQDLVNAYIEMSKNQPATDQQTAQDLTDSEVNSIHNSVGGEKEYNKILNWASNNLDDARIKGFDSLVSLGNAKAIELAVSGLKAEYENSEGYEGRMLTGKAAQTTDVFRSQQELVAAMRDPRYENDPAYQQDIYDKLQRSSNVKF
tara:strand:+ start:258 stop:1025 length:768 start_codon:yes stop_codon:yes gene_type:complete